jgi:hypothetical protein
MFVVRFVDIVLLVEIVSIMAVGLRRKLKSLNVVGVNLMDIKERTLSYLVFK